MSAAAMRSWRFRWRRITAQADAANDAKQAPPALIDIEQIPADDAVFLRPLVQPLVHEPAARQHLEHAERERPDGPGRIPVVRLKPPDGGKVTADG